MVEKEIDIKFQIKNMDRIALIAVIAVFFGINLWVTFSSNIIFGDEAFHTHSSKWMAKTGEIPKYIPLYETDIHKQAYTKYVSSHILMAGLFSVLGFSEFLVKLIMPLLSLLTAIILYLLARKHFPRKTAFLIIPIFLGFPAIATYSVLFYADIFLLFFASLATYFMYEAFEKRQETDSSGSVSSFLSDKKYFILTGIFTGLSMLAKKSGFILLPMIILWYLYLRSKEKSPLLFRSTILAVVIALVISGPWFARNLSLFGTVECGFPVFSDQACKIEPGETGQRLDRLPNVGSTEQTLLQYGLTNYIEFSYSLILFFLAVCGLFLVFVRRNKLDRFAILMFITFGLLLTYFAADVAFYRVEDFSRQMLLSILAFGFLSFLFIDEIINTANKHHKHIGVIVILVVLFISFSSAKAKGEVMISVKKFSAGFYEASNWIKANTPQDSILLSLWGHQTAYTTERKTYWVTPKDAGIVLASRNQTGIDTMKKYGLDYIFVQKWSIYQGDYYQGYPDAFVNWIASNPAFTKEFENAETVVYKIN